MIKKLYKIGKGSYGSVYKCIDTSSNEFVAVKYIKINDSVEGIPPTAIKEIQAI